MNSEFTHSKGITKYILRNSAKDIVHNDVLFDKNKKGFNASIDTLLDPKDILERRIYQSKISEFIDRKNLENILKRKYKDNQLSKFIFNVIN